MNYDVPPGQKIRMITILALIGICAGGILARAVQLQFYDAPRLQELARRQHKHTIELKAKRGDILDLRGDPLAASQEKSHVYVLPEQVTDKAKTAARLAPVLRMAPQLVLQKLTAADRFFWLARGLSFEQAEAVAALKLPGINLLPAAERYYPGGTLASNLLGFTRKDDVGQGLEGLEYQYEQMLAGSTIRIWQERDGLNRPLFISDQGPAFNFRPGEADSSHAFARLFSDDSKGTSLRLTILRPLQYVAEKELDKGVRSAGAKSGCVVVMEPATGRILAMASDPTFDPNHFQDYSQNAFRNKCVTSAYEPGSTFKVFVAAAALETRAIRPDEKFFCENGSYALGGETISDTSAHGVLSVAEIIALSSNIGASKIGERLGRDRLYQAAQAFGFGDKSGIDFPGESAGLLRPVREWSQVAVGTVSFGQGVSATPLQMATALSALANQGALMKPYLVESVIQPDGSEKLFQGPVRVRQVISPETARRVTEYMKKAVSPGFTGANAAVPGYTVAGKTGTAQKANEKTKGYAEGKYVVSFMGFLPADRPRLAMIVVLDEPVGEKVFGGTIAAPIFQAIAKQAMVLLKVPSSAESPVIADSGSETIPEPSAASRVRSWESAREWQAGNLAPRPEGDLIMLDLRGLTVRQALKALTGFPGQVEVAGTGVVMSQSPAPGTALIGQSLVRLQLGIAP